jgi:N6-L-threonylcarbamoyladenine synthase
MGLDFYVLGIETSCDETSVAVVKNGREVLSNVISSQVDLHKEYGGVVPEIASRRHVEWILPVMDKALRQAGISLEGINAISVTYGPGLVGALLVGVSVAKAVAFSLKKPLVGVHHIEGHIAANYIDHPKLEPPFLSLVVSGGHTHIIRVSDYRAFEILGKTRDDAVGEAFDKVARVLGLGYPGGPAIDALAKEGDAKAIVFKQTSFGEDNFDFSFSGLKTSVIHHVRRLENQNLDVPKASVAASFQKAAVEILIKNTLKALRHANMDTVVLAGGVSANSFLREEFKKRADALGIRLFYPSPILCTDNAAMIASAGYYSALAGNFSNLSLNAVPNLKIGH